MVDLWPLNHFPNVFIVNFGRMRLRWIPIIFSIRKRIKPILFDRLRSGPIIEPNFPTKSVLAKNLSLDFIPLSLVRIAWARVINLGNSN